MMQKIITWLAPPVFLGDENKTRRARLLNLALLTLIALSLIIVAGILAGGRTPLAVIAVDAVVLVPCLVLRYWIHQGRVGLAGSALLTVAFVVITGVIAILGTIRTPTTTFYMLLVIAAGLLFDLGGMIAMTALCSLAIAGLIAAENLGWLPRPDYTNTITQWVTFTALFAWAGSLTFSALQVMRQALARAEQEIAERKRSEESLRRQSQIMGQVHDAIIATDLKGFIVEWNPGAERMFGYSAEEALGQPITFVYPPDQLAFLTNEIQPQVRKKGWHETEARLRKKSGQDFLAHLSLAALKDSQGVVVGMAGSAIDITERKRAEEALRQSEERFRVLTENTSDVTH